MPFINALFHKVKNIILDELINQVLFGIVPKKDMNDTLIGFRLSFMPLLQVLIIQSWNIGVYILVRSVIILVNEMVTLVVTG